MNRARTLARIAVPGTAFLAAAVAGATRSDSPAEGPPIRVGLALAADTTIRLESHSGMSILDAQTGSPLFRTDADVEVRVVRSGEHAVAVSEAGDTATVYAVRAEPAGEDHVRVGGDAYRGAIEVFAVEEAGLNVVNEVPLEDYLLGVVPIEIGPRGPEELAAVAAQAVAARTYAIAHLRAREAMGFDVFGSVQDQAYGGVVAERPEATAAVRETAGTILVYDGLPIRAMYHSTCGGRTAAVEEVLDRPPAPYLQSVPDRAPDGTDYCAASPRYRWVETLDRSALDGRIRAQITRIFGARPEQTGAIRELRVAAESPSGRVHTLALRGERAEFLLDRLDIRIALQNEGGRILGSTDFEIVHDDDRIELHGRGFGHGSGMCQWGAIGRARAGQTWEAILGTYYRGAELVRVY